MKGATITPIGCTEAAQREIKEILGVEASQIGKAAVEFEAKEEDLAKLSYLGQSNKRVLRFLGKCNVEDDVEKIAEYVKEALDKDELKEFEGKTFCATCDRTGKHSFTSVDVAEEVGKYLGARFSQGCNLKKFEISLHISIIDYECIFGVDYGGVDLSKRDYKIFTKPGDLNGSIAFTALMFSGYKANDVVVDPFTTNGTIALEAALYATKRSVHFYHKEKFSFKNWLDVNLEEFDKVEEIEKDSIVCFDKELATIKAAQKNAKIAGCQDSIRFGRADIEWLDTKLDKESVDHVVTAPPFPSKHKGEKQIEKIMKELFYQLDFVLKPEGRITFIAPKVDHIAPITDKFVVESENAVMQGKQELKILVMKRT